MKPSEFLIGVSSWLNSQVGELYDYSKGRFIISEEPVFTDYDARVRKSLKCPGAQNIHGAAGGNMEYFLCKYGVFVNTPVTGEIVAHTRIPIIGTNSETLVELDKFAEEGKVAGAYLYASFQQRKSDPSRFLVSRDLIKCTGAGKEYRELVGKSLEYAVKEFALITRRSNSR